jgi:hypothetical protein
MFSDKTLYYFQHIKVTLVSIIIIINVAVVDIKSNNIVVGHDECKHHVSTVIDDCDFVWK